MTEKVAMQWMRKGLIAATLVIVPLSSVFARTPTDEQVDLYERIAKIRCDDFKHGGSSRRVEIKGAAKAELDGLIQKLVDAGIEGAGVFSADSYTGGLRENIDRYNDSGRNCKSDLYNSLFPSDSDSLDKETGRSEIALEKEMSSIYTNPWVVGSAVVLAFIAIREIPPDADPGSEQRGLRVTVPLP